MAISMLATILAKSKVYGEYTKSEQKPLLEVCEELNWSTPTSAEVVIGDYGLQMKITFSNNTFIYKGIEKCMLCPPVGTKIAVEKIYCTLLTKGEDSTIKVGWAE